MDPVLTSVTIIIEEENVSLLTFDDVTPDPDKPGSGVTGIRAIQHYLVRRLLWPVGPNKASSGQKPAPFPAKAGSSQLPWFPVFPVFPYSRVFPVFPYPLYLWSFLIAFERRRRLVEEYPGIPGIQEYTGIQGNKARRAVSG